LKNQGKSYSIIGYGANRGIVPQLCEKIFEQMKIKKETDKEIQFEVTFSMIEIYNEIVRDLLSSKPSEKKGLSIHEKPGRGFYSKIILIYFLAYFSF
jgi:kinesin family protein 1